MERGEKLIDWRGKNESLKRVRIDGEKRANRGRDKEQ